MRILHGLASYPPDLRPCVTALGAFDGIHLGHALLISTAVERGRALGLPSVVCTFHPHPASVLWPENAGGPIATLEDNLERMKGLGADAGLIIPFTLEFSRMEAETFVDEVLVDTLRAREGWWASTTPLGMTRAAPPRSSPSWDLRAASPRACCRPSASRDRRSPRARYAGSSGRAMPCARPSSSAILTPSRGW